MELCRPQADQMRTQVEISNMEDGQSATGMMLWEKLWLDRWDIHTISCLAEKPMKYSQPIGQKQKTSRARTDLTKPENMLYPRPLENLIGIIPYSSRATSQKRLRNSRGRMGLNYRFTEVLILSRLF